MAARWKTFLRISGLGVIAAGVFTGLPAPMPLILVIFGIIIEFLSVRVEALN